jgi:hypothetical protein
MGISDSEHRIKSVRIIHNSTTLKEYQIRNHLLDSDCAEKGVFTIVMARNKVSPRCCPIAAQDLSRNIENGKIVIECIADAEYQDIDDSPLIRTMSFNECQVD